MKQDVSEILKRQLLLMGYKPKDNLSENVERINNQILLNEQGAADRYSNYLNSEEGIRQHDIEMEKKIASTYPNYCWNNGEGAIVPGENEFGLSGVDAIPTGESGETKFCAYRGAGNTLLYLPIDVQDIYFMKGDIGEYDSIIKHAMNSNNSDPVKPEYVKIFSEYITSTHFKDSVFEFTLSNGLNFTPMRQRILAGGGGNNKNMHYKFLGYFNKESNSYYENPIWKDDRTEYQKFVDDWGTWIQIGAAIATAIAGLATGGASWVLTAEILIELGLGVWVAQREFEKGDNIAAVASVVFGLLPMLKLTKWFPGVSDEVFKSLSKKLSESGLESSNDVAEYITWYSTKLNEDEKMLMSKLLKQDEVNRNKMLKEIGEALGKESQKTIDDGLITMIKTNPKILKDISFFKRLWVRELGTAGALMLLTTILESCCGESWNNTTKMKFSKVYSFIPSKTKELLAWEIINNPENSSEIIENAYDNVHNALSGNEELKGNFSDWCEKYVIEPAVIESGGETHPNEGLTENGDDDFTFTTHPETITPQQLDSLIQSGYMKYSDYFDCCIDQELEVYPTNYKTDTEIVSLVKIKK